MARSRAFAGAVAALVASYATDAPAQEETQFPEWYIGGGISYAEISAGSLYGLNQGSDSTDSNTGFVVTAGHRFSRHLAAEIGYLEAETLRFETLRGFLCVEPELCRVDVEQDTSALTLAAVGVWPLGDVWSIYAKLGAAAWDATAEQRFSSPSGSLEAREHAKLSGTELLIGFGVGAALARGVGLRLDYAWFDTDDALLAVERAAGFQQLALEIFWRF